MKQNLQIPSNIIKKSLGQLAATLSVDERLAVKEEAEQFIRSHDYFSEVWKYLGPPQKEKILNTVADGKGIIPYEKIVDTNSMSLTLENSIFLRQVNFTATLSKSQ